MTEKKTYFDHQRVALEILAALVLSDKPLNVAEFTTACASAPDRQAVSDTLRRLKLATPPLIMLASNKRWRYNPDHISLIKSQLPIETFERVSLRMNAPQRRKISVPQIRRAILAILHANTQAGQNLTPYHVLLEIISSEYVIERRQLSQILNVMKNDGDIGLPKGRKRCFFIVSKPDTQASLFGNELPTEHNMRDFTESDTVIEDMVFPPTALETALAVATNRSMDHPSAASTMVSGVLPEDPGISPNATSHVTGTAPIEKKAADAEHAQNQTNLLIAVKRALLNNHLSIAQKRKK
jgi:hypothetical protein